MNKRTPAPRSHGGKRFMIFLEFCPYAASDIGSQDHNIADVAREGHANAIK